MKKCKFVRFFCHICYSLFKCLTVNLEKVLSIGYKESLKIDLTTNVSIDATFSHPEYMHIGKGCSFAKNCRIECWDKFSGYHFSPRLKIGDNCNFGEYTHVTAMNNIVIGDGLLTGRFVLIGDHNHGKCESKKELETQPYCRKLYSKGTIVIGNNVWLGDKVAILAGVTIGDGSVVGANSVVTKSIPANCIAAGNPARVIKEIK